MSVEPRTGHGVKIIPPSAIGNHAALREQARLDALASYDVLDSPAEASFDRLTKLAQRIFDVPMSTITFIDAHRQWFKSRQGMAACESDRAPALCNVAIQLPDALIVPDTAADERFADNPFVRGEPNIRFYAGIQIRSPDRLAVGTLCAMDTRPRSFSAEDRANLIDLGALATDLLEMRRRAGLAQPGGRDRAAASDPHRVLKAGRLIFNDGKASIRCTVRALARERATVDVITTAGIPGRVALMIETDAVSRLCDVVSRDDTRLELAFES